MPGPGAIHRDRLLEHLWPELPAERGSRALDTTLHELRRTLDPLAAPRSGASPIVREGEVYRLVLGERDSWDAGEFVRLAGADGGAADEGALERMLARGGALARRVPARLPLRALVRGRAPRRWSAGASSSSSAWRARSPRWAVPAAAIERYRQLVEPDREREGWHRALMRAYAQAGERPLALRQFHACRAILRGRIGIEPSEETRELYTSLL